MAQLILRSFSRVEGFPIPPEGRHCSPEMLSFLEGICEDFDLDMDNGSDGSLYIMGAKFRINAAPGDWVLRLSDGPVILKEEDKQALYFELDAA